MRDLNFLPLLNLLAFLAAVGYAIYLFAHLLYSRITFIKLGKSASLKKDVGERINAFLINVFGQKKLFKDPKSGIMHFILFYGFLLVQFGAIDLIWKGLKPGISSSFWIRLPLLPLSTRNHCRSYSSCCFLRLVSQERGKIKTTKKRLESKSGYLAHQYFNDQYSFIRSLRNPLA